MIKHINLQTDLDALKTLKPGEKVLLSGKMYTARDQAHKRIVEAIKNNKQIEFNIKNSSIFYVGPSPAKPGNPIGAAGPTTSYRMDPYAPFLIENGLKIMIGKGKRNNDVIDAIKKYGAVYFSAIGGTAALLASTIKSSKIIMYEDLMAEAIRELEVENFPVIVNIDYFGNEFKTKKPIGDNMLLKYNNISPILENNNFIAKGAVVLGNVRIGKNSSIWYNTVLRGDVGSISIGENTNVQDNSIIHTLENGEVTIGNYVTIGHAVNIHNAIIHDLALIGNGAIILDNAEIGEGTIIAAGTLIPPRKKIPPRVLVMGNPYKIIKELTDKEIEGTKKNSILYCELAKKHYEEYK